MPPESSAKFHSHAMTASPAARETTWRLLPLTAVICSSPPLLIKSHFTSTSYTIQLTDLSHLWYETLPAAAIASRAHTHRSAIDPAEDETQLQILLQKLALSLTQSADALALTSRGDELLLRTEHALPGGLPALHWIFHLRRGTSSKFTDAFVLPLVERACTAGEQVRELLTVVTEKDRVIEKLVDTLEEVKADVNAVLGASRARRGGLLPFDEGKWREEGRLKRKERRYKAKQVIEEVFASGLEQGISVQPLQTDQEWWAEVEDNGEAESGVWVANLAAKPSGDPDDEETASEDEDEFVVRRYSYIASLCCFYTDILPQALASQPSESSRKPSIPARARDTQSPLNPSPPASSLAQRELSKITAKLASPLPPLLDPDDISTATSEDDARLKPRALSTRYRISSEIGGKRKPTVPENSDEIPTAAQTIGTIGERTKTENPRASLPPQASCVRTMGTIGGVGRIQQEAASSGLDESVRLLAGKAMGNVGGIKAMHRSPSPDGANIEMNDADEESLAVSVRLERVIMIDVDNIIATCTADQVAATRVGRRERESGQEEVAAGTSA